MAPKRRILRRSQTGHVKNKWQRQRKSTSRTPNREQADAVTKPVRVEKSGKKALNCSICRRKLKIPQMLPCGHYFCKDDLICLAPLGTKNILCPQCRQQSPVPNGDTTKFPINFHLKELVEEACMTQHMTGGGEVKFSCTCCDVGNQSEVVAKCQECAHYLCTTGLAKHKHYERWRQHNVCVLEETIQIHMVLRSAVTTSHEYKYERKADDWAIFDALYDEEHSTHLLQYWTQLCDLRNSAAQTSISKRNTPKTKAKPQHDSNSSKWQEAMVNHYLMCLDNLGESGLTDRDTLAKKQQQVATVFKQAGQYDKALELIDKTLDMEKKELGERPGNMSQLFYLAAIIYSQIFSGILMIRDMDAALIQKQIEYARLSMKIRKTMKGDDNRFKLGRILRVVSGALRDGMTRGGGSVPCAADAKTEGMKYIDESIEIFKQLNAKGNLAKSLVTKANLERDGTDEQERLYRKALEMSKEAYGENSISTGNIYYNLSILYENRCEYYRAYRWLVKCREIREKIYGRHHPMTQLAYDNLDDTCYDKYTKV